MLSRNKEVHTSSNPHMYTHILKKASSSCYKRRQEVFNTGIIYSFTDRFAGGWSASHYPPPRRSGLISPRPASAILWLDRSIGRKASEQAIYIYIGDSSSELVARWVPPSSFTASASPPSSHCRRPWSPSGPPPRGKPPSSSRVRTALLTVENLTRFALLEPRTYVVHELT